MGSLLGGGVGWITGAGTGVGAALGGIFSAPLAVAATSAVRRARPYPQGSRGWALLALDVTWSALNTWAGALFLYVLRLRGNRLEPDRSAGSGRVHLAEPAITGYATTIGIVVAGCSSRLERHEQVHVFQARLLGPLYLPLVGLGFVVATVLPYWLLSRQARAQVTGMNTYFVRGVYPHTWHEWWAYRLDR